MIGLQPPRRLSELAQEPAKRDVPKSSLNLAELRQVNLASLSRLQGE